MFGKMTLLNREVGTYRVERGREWFNVYTFIASLYAWLEEYDRDMPRIPVDWVMKIGPNKITTEVFHAKYESTFREFMGKHSLTTEELFDLWYWLAILQTNAFGHDYGGCPANESPALCIEKKMAHPSMLVSIRDDAKYWSYHILRNGNTDGDFVRTNCLWAYVPTDGNPLIFPVTYTPQKLFGACQGNDHTYRIPDEINIRGVLEGYRQQQTGIHRKGTDLAQASVSTRKEVEDSATLAELATTKKSLEDMEKVLAQAYLAAHKFDGHGVGGEDAGYLYSHILSSFFSVHSASRSFDMYMSLRYNKKRLEKCDLRQLVPYWGGELLSVLK